MKETRAGKYGRNLALWVDYTINTMPNSEGYKIKFLQELSTYSLEPKKKGTLPNEGCVYELDLIVECDIQNPEDLAKLIKEGIHLMYQKGTSSRVIAGLKNHLETSL